MKPATILPPNPLGIHFQKASLILVLFFIHGEAWINQLTHRETFVQDTLAWKFIIFFGMFNVLLPSTAGATLRLGELANFDGWRLQKFDWKPVLWLAGGLALAESVKAAVAISFELLFAWDVLHFIGISMLLILGLARLSIVAVWVSLGLCLVLTPWMRDWLHPLQLLTYEDVLKLNSYQIQNWFLLMLVEVTFATLAFKLLRTRVFAPKYKVRLGLLLLLSFFIAGVLAFRYETPVYFMARIINLPTGILIGDELGMHYWPLFPWYAEIAFGYALFDLLLRVRRQDLRLAIFLGSIAAELFYFYHSYASVIQEYDPTTGFSAKMFRGSLDLVYVNLALFAGLTVMWDAIARSARVRSFLEKHPRWFEIPFMFSRTILYSYLFINTAGFVLAYPFALYLPYPVALILFPIFMIVIWLDLGERVMKLLARRSLIVRFKAGG